MIKAPDISLHLGDNRLILPARADNSLDSCVTDPPYELDFMGQDWDRSGIAFDVAMWQQVYRVLKPGAYLVAFSHARTYHRVACAIEDAGFIIRDQIFWIYSEGFPKSHNLKDEHKGKGTALKPAHEPIVIAQKPLTGTVLHNVNTWGTGAFNIDQCRVEFAGESDLKAATWGRGTDIIGGQYVGGVTPSGKVNIEANPAGRWPANIIHDGSEAVMNAFAAFGDRTSGKPTGVRGLAAPMIYGKESRQPGTPVTGYGDSGGIDRFYYCAKATKRDREEGLRAYAKQIAGVKNSSGRGFSASDPYKTVLRANTCPTVKPTSIMRYLCRLVTPAGGTVLDQFMGSGSTGKGAVIEGFSFFGIDKKPEHYGIANARIRHAAKKYGRQTALFNHQ